MQTPKYVLYDDTETTREEIAKAYEEGRAVLIWSHDNGRNVACLALDGIHRDTRGECWSVWDEVWTTVPESLAEALLAARVWRK